MRLKGTYLYESGFTDKLKEKGIFIDLIPMEKIPCWKWKQKLDYWYGHCIRGIHNYTTPADKIISYCVFPVVWIVVQLTRFVNLFSLSDQVADIYGWKPTGYYNGTDIFPTKRIPFEGFMASAPNNPDAMLKALFGNYMQIPPKEKRAVHATKIEFYD